MVTQLFWMAVLSVITVSIHGGYSLFLLHRLHVDMPFSRGGPHRLRAQALALGKIVISLLLIHCAEAAIWALFYMLSGAFSTFEPSLYFSLTSYSTIGYGDLLLPQGSRLVGVVEGLVGTFMCGWSVALLVAVLQHIGRVDGLLQSK